MHHNLTHRLLMHSLAVASLIALSGCSEVRSRIGLDTPIVQTEPSSLESVLGELPAQSLRKGECGMFLWSRTDDRKLILFSRGNDDGAIVVLEGREQNIPRVATDGRVVLNYSEQQSYVWRGYSLQVKVDFDQRQGIGRGAIIPAGTIRMSRRDGWEYVVPVGGLIACEGQ
jgi:hypothetical protein